MTRKPGKHRVGVNAHPGIAQGILLFMLVTLCGTLWVRSQEKGRSPLRQVQTVPLMAVAGRIDHMSLDRAGRRLFIAALGNNSLEVIDLETGKHLRSLTGLPEVQDVKYLGKENLISLSCGGDGSVRFYDSRTYKLRGKVDVGDDADNMRYDPEKGMLYVGYGDGGIAVIDAVSFTVVAKIPLPAHPESFQFSRNGTLLYVNTPGAGSINIIDLGKRTVARRIPLRAARGNFPMAVDEKDHRLLVGCRNPAKLLVINTDSDSVVAALPVSGDCDDIFLNDSAGTAYLSCGEGMIDVIRRVGPDSYEIAERIPTSPGARTCLFDPKEQKLFLAIPRRGGHTAAIRVFDVKP